RRGVETRRLEEVTVEEDDKRRIEQGMGKCSRWFRGHDQAAACDAPLPAPAELERDINELNDFISDITKRRERIRRKRAKV
ncbi:MAG: hypothetical protein PHS26_12810, partial [Actinomycetota bacterium]|nr:hypothetical protein [Actinomycetota bacterium]